MRNFVDETGQSKTSVILHRGNDGGGYICITLADHRNITLPLPRPDEPYYAAIYDAVFDDAEAGQS